MGVSGTATIRWAAAVDLPLVLWALADFYKYPSPNSAHVCPESHLAATGWFLLAFLLYSLVMPWAGNACCSTATATNMYCGTCFLVCCVVAMWVPIEAFALACGHSGLLWFVVVAHGAVCYTACGVMCCSLTCALTKDLCRDYQWRKARRQYLADAAVPLVAVPPAVLTAPTTVSDKPLGGKH